MGAVVDYGTDDDDSDDLHTDDHADANVDANGTATTYNSMQMNTYNPIDATVQLASPLPPRNPRRNYADYALELTPTPPAATLDLSHGSLGPRRASEPQTMGSGSSGIPTLGMQSGSTTGLLDRFRGMMKLGGGGTRRSSSLSAVPATRTFSRIPRPVRRLESHLDGGNALAEGIQSPMPLTASPMLSTESLAYTDVDDDSDILLASPNMGDKTDGESGDTVAASLPLDNTPQVTTSQASYPPLPLPPPQASASPPPKNLKHRRTPSFRLELALPDTPPASPSPPAIALPTFTPSLDKRQRSPPLQVFTSSAVGLDVVARRASVVEKSQVVMAWFADKLASARRSLHKIDEGGNGVKSESTRGGNDIEDDDDNDDSWERLTFEREDDDMVDTEDMTDGTTTLVDNSGSSSEESSLSMALQAGMANASKLIFMREFDDDDDGDNEESAIDEQQGTATGATAHLQQHHQRPLSMTSSTTSTSTIIEIASTSSSNSPTLNRNKITSSTTPPHRRRVRISRFAKLHYTYSREEYDRSSMPERFDRFEDVEGEDGSSLSPLSPLRRFAPWSDDEDEEGEEEDVQGSAGDEMVANVMIYVDQPF